MSFAPARMLVPPPSAWVADLEGKLHFLVDYEDDPVMGHPKPVEIAEARRVEPPKRESALVVRLRRVAVYGTQSSASRPVYCKVHGRYELVRSEVIAVRDEFGEIKPVPRVREYSIEEVRSFEDMLRRRGTGYTRREGVLAYLVSCGRGVKSQVTGFLRASGFSKFRDVSVAGVGQDLTRIQKLGLTPPEMFGYWRVWSTEKKMVAPLKVNRVFAEKEYILRPEAAERIKRKRDWWKILKAKPKDVPKELGLNRWF